MGGTAILLNTDAEAREEPVIEAKIAFANTVAIPRPPFSHLNALTASAKASFPTSPRSNNNPIKTKRGTTPNSKDWIAVAELIPKDLKATGNLFIISQIPANELNIRAIPIGIPIRTNSNIPPKAIKPSAGLDRGASNKNNDMEITASNKPSCKITSFLSPIPF